MSDTGRIDLRVEDDSMFLSDNLPFVVRNAWHTVVATGTTRQGVSDPLPVGLYSVEVMTPRGVEQTQIVQVTPEQPARLVVTEDGVHLDGPPMPPIFTAEAAEAADELHPSATLLEMRHCTLAAHDDKGWIFLPDPRLTDVPVARFTLGDTLWDVSLPLNPKGREPTLRQCRVRVEQTGATSRLDVALGDRRRVFRMLLGMLHENGVAIGKELLDTAASALLWKYSDPVAAALGGLTLHRFGRLHEKQDWVENLSRDFDWLPDGRILCAALLQRDDDASERDRGLDLLLTATERRPLYTDGLSLGLELLRRWPGEGRSAERRERLERLAEYSAAADWESIALTTAVGA
jgi:hypothetical protein